MSGSFNHPPLISVVIVNYHSWDKLRACLTSLVNQQLSSCELQIIVVDNDPNDHRFSDFAAEFSQVSFVKNQGNYGFANGCNTGAKSANGQFLLFINPDTEVLDDVFSPMLEAISKLPSFSIVATQKVTTKGKPERIERFFPRWYTLTGIGKAFHRYLLRHQISQDFSVNKSIVFPEWVSGSVVFIRRNDFEALNGWNENFWMYSEDVDLCKRASEKGGVIALLREVTIIHNHGGSSRINPVTSALTKSEVYISRHVYLSLNFNKASLYLVQFILALKSLIKTSLIALCSLILFTHPKAKVSRRLFYNLCRYYYQSIIHQTWLSPRSTQYKK